MTPDFDACAELPDFGIFHLSVSDAAVLVAVCMAFDGGVSNSTQAAVDKAAEAANVWAGQWDSEPIQKALSREAKGIRDQLIRSIDSGELSSPVKRRNMKGELLPDGSFISCAELEQWAQARGNVLSDPYNAFIKKESARFESLRDYAVKLAQGHIEQQSHAEPPAVLLSQPAQKPPEGLDPRERATMLRMIKVLARAQGLTLEKPHSAADQLEALAAHHGIDLGRKGKAIADKLTQARDID